MLKVIILGIALIVISYFLLKKDETFGVIKDCNSNVRHLIQTYPVGCDYEEIKLLGKGEKAEVYQTNCNGKDYAMKVTTSYNPKSFLDEVDNQILVGRDISPSVLDAFVCNDKKGYIVMEQLKDTVTDYIRKETTNPMERIKLVNKFREIAKEKFRRAAELGIFHSDTHIDNMMIKIDELDNPDLLFIDWGISSKKISTESEIRKKLNDIDQTFDLLQREINTNTTKTPAAPKKVQKTRQIFTERKEEPESPPKKLKLPGFSTDSKINPSDYSHINNVESPYSSPYKMKSNLDFTPIKPSSFSSLSFDTPTKTPQKKALLFGDDDEDDSFLIKRLTKGEENEHDYPSAPSSPF